MPFPPCTFRYAFVVLAVVPAGLFGLQDQTAAAPVPTHLMKPRFTHPTAVGTKWVYDRGGSDETYLITHVEEKNGARLISIESANGDGKTTVPHQKLLVTGQEWCLAEECGSPYDPPWCLLKFPHAEGHKWEFSTSRTDLQFQIIGAAVQADRTEQRKVPAGTFDAVKVNSTYSFGAGGAVIASTHWYASGIGLLQIDDPPVLVLKSFKPGKE